MIRRLILAAAALLLAGVATVLAALMAGAAVYERCDPGYEQWRERWH